MQITVSGKFSVDHSDSAIDAVAKIRGIVEKADLDMIKTELDGFVFFPVVISDQFRIGMRSHRSYSRKENAEFVNEEIDANDWSASDERRRLELMMDAFEKAIRLTRANRLDDEAKDEIVIRLRRAMEVNCS